MRMGSRVAARHTNPTKTIVSVVLAFVMMFNGIPAHAVAEAIGDASGESEQNAMLDTEQPQADQPAASGESEPAPAEQPAEQPAIEPAPAEKTNQSEGATQGTQQPADAPGSGEAIEDISASQPADPQSADSQSEATSAQDTKPAQSFTGAATNGIKVLASVDEGVFPAGATMEVRSVDSQTARLIGMQVVDEGQSVVSVQAVDISFYDLAHKELEPQDGQGVHVAIQLPESVQGEDLVVAHQANNGTVQEVQDVQTNEATNTAEFVGTEFSVYAVIETTPVVTFEFYESETATDPVRTQVVVEGDYLYAPGPPAVIPEGMQLSGWVIAGQENPIDFVTSGDGTYTLTRGDIEQAVEGAVRVNARYGEVYYATFYDQSGNVFSRIAVAADQTIAAEDLPAKFACTGVDESLAGWSTTRKDAGSNSYEGSATDMVEFPLSLSADTPYYPVIASAHVIHFDANRMLGMKENATYGYKTMTVSYTPPQVVAYGANTVQPKTNPTAEGGAFTFVEWCRDPECTQPFVWGNPLDNDITLYAKWQPATTTYRVNVWKEKVDVKLTDAAHTSTIPDPGKFDFWSSTAYEAPVLVEDNGVYVPNKVSIADDAPQHTADHGFVYRASDTEKVVQPDGTTELNVYWNREERSVTFHEGTEIGYAGSSASYFKSFDFHKTYTGLYDQSFELYGWTWPTDSLQTTGVVAGTTGSWRAQFQTYGEVNPNTQYTERMSYVRGSRGVENVPSVHLKTGFNDALATDYYYLVENEPDISLYYVLQDTNGNWPVDLSDPTIIALQSNAKNKFHVTDLFPNFEPTGYSIDSIVGETERLAIPRNPDPDEDMRIPPQATATTKRFVYFSRDTHKVRFYTDASKSTQAFPEETKYWNQDISGYGDDQYKLDDPLDGTKTFAGWYYAPGVTDPSLAIDWTNLVMPANDIELYPIWVANSVHVLIDPAADDVQLNAGQSKAFWTDLGDTIDMTYLDAATRADHTLDGWYLPNNGYAAAWTASDVIGAGICDCDENGDPIKTQDPLYKNSYYTLTLRARWSYSRSAKVRYDLNGGTNTTGNENAFADSADQYLFGGNVQVTTATPTPPEGKVFLAWQDKVAGSVDAHSASHTPGSTFAYDDEGMVTTEGGQDYIVLKAVYVTHNAPTSTITYYPNYTGATSNPKVSESYEWGEQITLPNNTFTRDGYELAGWSDMPEVSTPDAQLFLAGSTVGVNAFGTTIDDVTNRGNNNLYAVWRKALAVEGKSATLEYNGTEQSVTGLKPNAAGYDNPRFQGDGGDWVEVVSDTARVSGTNVGTYTGTVGSTKVLGTQGADNGQDISERFKVEATPGTLIITPRDLSSDAHENEVAVTMADAGAYDGKQKKPAATVTVTIDGAAHPLVEGTDFTVAYSNNVNAAKSTDQNAPTATIAFKGNYAGTASTTFSIAKATVTVMPKQAQSKVHGTDDPTLEYEATGLVGSDTLSGTLGRAAGDAAGEYAYDVSGLSAGDNYEIKLADDADKFTITRKQLTFTWPATTAFEYDGNEKSITATIADGLVKSGDEVTLTYENNKKTNVGSYTAKVTGLAGTSAGNYYFASDEPTASQTWSITKAKQAQPTVTEHAGTSGKTASDGTVTVTSATGTTAEYSTDGGATWADVPAGGVITGLSAGDVLVRTKGDDNHDPSDPVTVTVGYKLTGTIYWDYTYSTPTSSGSSVPDESAWSMYAMVTLSNGSQTPQTFNVTATKKTESTAEGTYAFEDVPLNAPVSVSIVPTMAEGATDKAANYTVTMRANNLDVDVNYSADCFDATWRVDINGVGTVDGVVPDTVYVKVLFAEDASDANDLSKYQVIVQQRDSDDVQRNGAACALSAGTGGVAYTATGSYPVWKTQSNGSTYYHKAQVVGYTVNGTYFDCTDKDYVSEGAMTYVNGAQDSGHNPMVVTIANLDVPVLEFNPNGEGATVATPYVLGSEYGSEVSAATITGNTATWTGYTFEGWYTAAAPTAGTKQETPLVLNGKTTLYAHWSQNQDAPTGLTATKGSSTTDAIISGVTDAMEYSTDSGNTWTSVTGTNIGELSRDTQVQIRYKEAPATETAWPKNASPATTITIQAKATQTLPDLTATKARTDSATDATVTVKEYDPTSKPAVFSTDGGNTWKAVPTDGVIGNLGAGTIVQVKYTEDDDYEASDPASATIAAKAQETITPTITAPSATTVRVTNPQPGVTYTLCDESGDPIAGADTITATAGDDVVFENCTPGTTYTVMPSIAGDADTNYTCTRSEIATTPKLDIAVGTAVPAAIERTYNGLAQTLVTALTGDDLPEGCTKVLYSIQYPEDTSWAADTATWTEDPSTGVNAQTYRIHVKYVGDDQHNDLVYDGTIDATIAPKSLKDTDISALALPSTMVYSGAPQGPAVVVRNTNLGAILTKDTDYTIEYGTATNVGDYSLIVRGTGNYTDAVDVDYHITPYQVGADDKLVVSLGTSEFTYNGAVQRPSEVTVVLNGTQLDEGVDYDLAYLDENGAPVASVNAGAYQAKVTLKGNYAGETAAGYTIKPKAIESDDVALTPTSLTYNGSEQGPAVSVLSSLATSTTPAQLVPGTDYLATGNTATGAGTYTVTVSGKGNFTGSVEKQFTIAPQEVKDLEVTFDVSMPADGFVYNGVDQRPSGVVVKVNGTSLESSAYTVAWPETGKSVNAGTYSVGVTLSGDYAGTTTTTLPYTIAPKPLTDADVALAGDSFTYDKNTAQGPQVTVTSELKSGQKTLLAATDYILSDATATDTGNYQVTVTGVGNYTGTVQKPYAIAKASVGTPGDTNKPTVKTLVYDGEAQELLEPPTALPEGCAKVQYGVSDGNGGATWSDTIPTGTNAGEYPIQVRYVGDKNHTDLDGGTITATVSKRSVTLTGRSATRVFNGHEQSIAGVEDTGATKLVSGHTHNAEAEAKGTNVGAHNGTITAATDVVITDAQGTNVTNNYAVTANPGTLTITKAPLTDNGKGDGLLANEEGKPIAADGTITGDLTKQVPLVSVTGTGESALYDGEDHVPTVKDAATGEPLPTSAYTVTYYNASDVENGKPVQGAVPLVGDAATKNPGQKVAIITCAESSNYQTGATIAVPMSLQTRPVTFVGESKSMVYDGQTHELTQTTEEGAGLVSGHTVSGLSYSAIGIDKGTYPGTITDAAQVKIMAGISDVTAFYAISTRPGTLTIGGQPVLDDGNGNAVEADENGRPKVDGQGNPIKRVTVSFDYDAAVYDGTEHEPTATDLLKNAPLAKNDDFVVEYYHATDIDEDGEPVEDAAPLDATVAAEDKVALVRFVRDYVGTVKVSTPVRKRSVTLTGTSASMEYTGAEQSVVGVEDTGDLKLVGGHTHNAVAVAAGTEAGAHTGTITAAADVVITDAQGADVTANYAVSTAAGTLAITPRAVNDGDPTSKINPVDASQGGEPSAQPVVSVTGSNPSNTTEGHNTPGTSSGDPASVYDGTEHGPSVADAQGKPLAQGTDYEVAYYDPADIDSATGRPAEGATPLDPADAGEKIAVVTFKGNYAGVVNVPVRVDPRLLHVTSASATKAYDGMPLVASGASVWVAGADGVPAGCGLVDGQTIAVTVTGEQTDAGSSPNTYVVRFADSAGAESAEGVRAEAATDAAYNGIAQDGKPTAKARNYAIQSDAADEGTLTVSPAKLTVTTPSATKAYDGKALTNSKGAKVDGLAQGETAAVTCTGSQTKVGSSKNTYTLAWGTAQKENYTVAKENLGTLTVTAAATSIATGSGSTSSVARSSLAHTADGTLTTLPACVAAAAIALIALALRKREHN